jgi:lipopolysaccharide transport system ATP-binding protein
MSNIVISVENLSKTYHLGQIGTGTFSHDLNVWWAKVRGKPNPLLRIGERDRGNRDGEELWALRDVSFKVKQGEVLGIIGRNGAGKSTLLKILSRVTAPTSGKIKVKGRIASLLEVGTGFHPELTGRENIYLNGAILGMSKQEVTRKFDEIVDFAEVEKFIDTPVKRYSSGMYVRLAFAVAAHLDPEILVVDEVLAVGDAEFQKKCLGKMGDVAKQGKTVLFVSHNMAAVENLCKRGIVVYQGQVLFDGSQIGAIQYYFRNLDKNVKGYSLLERDDREGNGLVRFTKIEFRDVSGSQVDVISSGDDVDICMFFATDRILVSENIHVGLTFYTALGVPVFSQSTRVMQVKFSDLPIKGVFICKLRRLPLPPSTYYIAINVKVEEEYADYIINATTINVVEGDYFGTSRFFPSTFGVCLVEGQWRLETVQNI